MYSFAQISKIIDGIDANKLGFKGSFDKYNVVEKAVDKPAEKSDVYEKLQEISGEIKTLNAKLDG